MKHKIPNFETPGSAWVQPTIGHTHDPDMINSAVDDAAHALPRNNQYCYAVPTFTYNAQNPDKPPSGWPAICMPHGGVRDVLYNRSQHGRSTFVIALLLQSLRKQSTVSVKACSDPRRYLVQSCISCNQPICAPCIAETAGTKNQ
jgi:hypothetical protein